MWLTTNPREPQNLDNSSVAADRLVGELKSYLQACVIIVLGWGYWSQVCSEPGSPTHLLYFTLPSLLNQPKNTIPLSCRKMCLLFYAEFVLPKDALHRLYQITFNMIGCKIIQIWNIDWYHVKFESLTILTNSQYLQILNGGSQYWSVRWLLLQLY